MMGIRSKLVISTLAVAFFVSVAPVCYSIHMQRNLLLAEFEARGVLIANRLARDLAQMATQLASINDPASVKAALTEQDILAAYVLNEKGMIVNDGTSSNTRKGRHISQFELVKDAVSQSSSFRTRREGQLIYVSGPVAVDGPPLGFVHLVMTAERVDKEVSAVMVEQAKILGGLLSVATLLALLVANIFRSPVKWMVDGMEAIKNGNYKVRIPVNAKDELGRLAIAINQVAANLGATTVSKRYLDEVLQSMADSLIVVDTDANIVTVNRATMEMLQYSERQLVGQPASLVCIDEGYQLTGSRLQHLLGEGTQQDHEMMYRSSTGALIPISFSGSPIRDNTGEVVGYVCIGKDITERKRAEVERERLNKQLVDTSRQAGMAEVATGVLHNVGNVLNSVNMSASLVAENVRKSKVPGLNRAVDMLNQHQDDLAQFLTSDDRGKQLPAYLSQLAEVLADEQTSMIGELTSLTNNIGHIKEIISMQQSYAKVSGVIESVVLSELVDEALRLNATSLEHHAIKVKREVDYVPATRTDKHKVLQVLVNLITNARDAMESAPEDQRVLLVRLRRDEKNSHIALIEVVDSGMGIPAENLTRIFTHGFTTKKKGHGFGLHSAALTAKEMGGAIDVHSDGPGKGATFTLSLPLEVMEARKS